MLKLKTTALTLLALGSSSVFAGTMGSVCAPGNVTVPCERSAWDFGAQALYLQSSTSGYNFLGDVTNSTATNTQKIAAPLSWGWGFMIEGSYHFSTGNDMNINWYHWNNKKNVNFPNSIQIIGLDTEPVLSGNSGTLKPRWDAANFELGQHVDFGEAKYFRFFGGVQYARLNNINTFNSTGGFTASPIVSVSAQRTITYNGFGPRGGVDMFYGFGHGLAMYGKAAAALLVGPQGYNGVTSSNFDSTIPVSFSASTNVIVPELESKLGGTYTYAMHLGDISLDIGWMWVNYFKGILSLGSSASTSSENVSNFALQGPYIGLKWVGNVA